MNETERRAKAWQCFAAADLADSKNDNFHEVAGDADHMLKLMEERFPEYFNPKAAGPSDNQQE